MCVQIQIELAGVGSLRVLFSRVVSSPLWHRLQPLLDQIQSLDWDTKVEARGQVDEVFHFSVKVFENMCNRWQVGTSLLVRMINDR